MVESFRSWRKLCLDSKLLISIRKYHATTKHTKDTKDLKLLHFNFLLRALRDLRGEMSVSILVAAQPPRLLRKKNLAIGFDEIVIPRSPFRRVGNRPAVVRRRIRQVRRFPM